MIGVWIHAQSGKYQPLRTSPRKISFVDLDIRKELRFTKEIEDDTCQTGASLTTDVNKNKNDDMYALVSKCSILKKFNSRENHSYQL